MSYYLHEAPTQRTHQQRPKAAQADWIDCTRTELSQLPLIHNICGHSAAGWHLFHAATEIGKAATTVARQTLIGQLQFAKFLLQLQHLIWHKTKKKKRHKSIKLVNKTWNSLKLTLVDAPDIVHLQKHGQRYFIDLIRCADLTLATAIANLVVGALGTQTFVQTDIHSGSKLYVRRVRKLEGLELGAQYVAIDGVEVLEQIRIHSTTKEGEQNQD